MKNHLTVVICILSSLLSAQESPSIDSMIFQGKEIVSDDPDASLVLTYQAYEQSITEDYYWGKANAAGWIAEAYYYKGQMDSMDKYNYIALQLSREENDLPATSDNLKSIAQSLSDRGNHAEALEYFYEAREIKEQLGDTTIMADIHLRIGAVFDNLDMIDTAMIHYDIALNYSRDIDHKELIGQSLNNIAILHKKLGQFEKSLETLLEAKSFFESIDNQYGLLINSNMLGVTYKSMERYDDALEAYELLKALSTELNFKRGHMAYGINTGTIYNLVGQYQKAEASYKLAIDIASDFDIPLSLSDARSGLGKSLLGQGRLYEAEKEVDAALELAQNLESLDKQLIAHKVAKDISQEKKDLEKTVAHLEAIQMLSDSIFHLDKAKQVDELQAKYEAAKKDAEISLLNKEAELDANRKRSLWGGLILLTIAGLASMYSLTQRSKRKHAILSKEKAVELEKRKHAEKELEYKKKELTARALQLASKNEFLHNLEQEIGSLKSSADSTVSSTSDKVSRMINSDQLDDKEWEQFSKEFSSIHQDFMDRLKSQYGDFSNYEWRLISLLKMNLSTKDIANIFRISSNGVKKARYRLRKKIDLASEMDIQDFLISF